MSKVEHEAYIESIYDGDTFTVVVEYESKFFDDSWWEEIRPNLFVAHSDVYDDGEDGLRERIRVRLLGIDAPEVRGEEKERGKVSADWVRGLTQNTDHVTIWMNKQDSFGRWLCDVQVAGQDLAGAMLDAGMAVVYAKSRSAGDAPIQHVPW